MSHKTMINKDLGFQLPSLEEFMELNPLTVSPQTLMIEAITNMSQPRQISLVWDTNQTQNISRSSYILVLEESILVGVLTERDVVKLSATGINLKTVTIGEVMTKNVITFNQSNFRDIYQVMSIINQHQIRHLPVVDDRGKLEGIISSDGIARALNPTNLLKLRSVADIVDSDVLQANSTTSVLELSRLMAQKQRSCVVIVEINFDTRKQWGMPVGIITERDIVQFQILGLDLINTSAQAVMSSPLECIKTTSSLLKVQQKMNKLRVRRMVVTNEFGQLQGIVSLQDMLKVFNSSELYGVIHTLKQELKQQTKYLQCEIEQRQISEKTLEENQQILKLFVRHTPAAIAMTDREMRYLAVSDRWIADYQIKDPDLIGKTHYEIFPELPQRWKQDHQDILTGKVEVLKSEEDSFERLDGRIDWLRWELRPWHDLQGKIGGLIMFSEVITEKKLLEQKLKSSEAQIRAVFEAMTDLVISIDLTDNSIQILPTKFADQDNATVHNQIIEQLQFQLFNSIEAEYYRSLNKQIAQTKHTLEFECSLKLNDCLIWFSINISAISSTQVLWVAHNVTHRKQVEENLFAEKELADVTLKSIGDAVITTDALGKVKYLNPVAENLTGWSTAEVRGKAIDEFFVIVNQFTRESVDNPINLALQENKICLLAANTILIAKDGTEYAIEDSAAPIRDRQGQLIGVIMVFHDVTESRNLAQELSWQATHDPLTKLYNRRKFEQELEAALQDAKDNSTQHVLCYLDLDRFKIINDTCGHTAGDKLLKQITNLFQQRIRASDIFARLGGDEFGLILYRCPINIAQKIAEQLRQSIQNFSFSCSGKTFKIGVSIGLVAIDSSTVSLANALNQADAACYAAKKNGRNCVYLYHEQDNILVQQHGDLQWVEKLNRALEENRFCLYAQKIVDILPLDSSFDQANCCHYEILLRLVDESEQLIVPSVFLPAAERYDLMPAIDRWVISTFLAGYEIYCQSRQARKLSLPTNLYTINLSGASINHREFSSFIQEQFHRYNIPPETICFEITETVAIASLDNAINLIKQLKNIGCSIALDDFGSGMCSFSYLKHLPVDYLKIDGSFVKNIANDHMDYATVECFNHLSKIMQIKTIAEFVEDDVILQNLKQIGIDYAQGYGIERPKPLNFSLSV